MRRDGLHGRHWHFANGNADAKEKKKDLKIAGSLNHPINYDEHRQKRKGLKFITKVKGLTTLTKKKCF